MNDDNATWKRDRVPGPGPSSPLPTWQMSGLTFWLFVAFCLVMLGLLAGMFAGWIAP